MSDYETPLITMAWCPGCRPDADPLAELLETRWCDNHREGITGEDDQRMTLSSEHLGSGVDAIGENCRAAAALIR